MWKEAESQLARVDVFPVPMKIKAITLWQPWASLWAAGIKIHETRSWPTTHKGLLAVHAAKHKDDQGRQLYDELCEGEHSDRIQAAQWLPSEFENLPFGAIVGVVTVTVCWRTYEMSPIRMSPVEYLDFLLGNFTAGRFAWEAVNACLFEKPIPWKGRQGFFNVDIPE